MHCSSMSSTDAASRLTPDGDHPGELTEEQAAERFGLSSKHFEWLPARWLTQREPHRQYGIYYRVKLYQVRSPVRAARKIQLTATRLRGRQTERYQ